MPAPIKPSELCALVPSGTSSLCQRIQDVFLRLPAKLCSLVSWMLNEDGTLSDAFKDEAQIIPTGTVIYRMSTVVPSGWLACDGQEVSRVTYALLFSIIGTTFGTGNGTTTFNLPNLQDRFLYGKGSTSTVGSAGGAAEHTLLLAETPPHTHPTPRGEGFVIWDSTTAGTQNWTGGPYKFDIPSTAPSSSVTGSAGGTGGVAGPHNNLPPFVRAVALIKT